MSNHLPLQYQELTYIESSGTQYIHTPFKINNDTDSVKYEFKYSDFEPGEVSEGTLWGARVAGSTRSPLFYINTTTGYTSFSIGSLNAQSTPFAETTVYADGEWSLELNGTAKTGTVKRNGVTLKNNVSYSSAGTIVSNYTYNVFAQNASDSAIEMPNKLRMYYWRLFINSVAVANLVPAMRKSDSAVGMYDTVTSTFFGNSGTGAFTAGDPVEIFYGIQKRCYLKHNIPSEYTQLDYIQSSGTQYIDTGIKPTQNTRALYECAVIDDITGVDSHLFGSRTTATSKAFDLAFMDQNTSETLRFISNETNRDVQTSLVTRQTIANKLVYDMSGTYVKVNGTTVATFSTTAYAGDYNLWIGGVNNAGTIHTQIRSQKIYGCSVWESGTLVGEFVPAKRNSDNVVGMYNLVTSSFVGNSGTGVFTAGNAVYFSTSVNLVRYATNILRLPVAYQELEYIKTTGNSYLNTEIIGNQNTKIETAFTISEKVNAGYTLFGGRLCGGQVAVAFWSYILANDSERCDLGNTMENGSVPAINTKYSVKLEAKRWYIDGAMVADQSSVVSFTTPVSIYIGAMNSNGAIEFGHKGNIYETTIYQDGTTLSRHFVPAKRISDSAIGMYDFVSNAFYPSAATAFVAGPEVTNYQITNVLKTMNYLSEASV